MPKLPQNRSKPGRSGSITRRQAIAAGGSALSGVGIYAGVINADAFTTGILERLSSISIADDQNAALGLTGFSAEETPTFENNLESDLTLTLSAPDHTSAEFDVGGTGSFEDPPVSFTIPAGDQEIVEMDADADPITVLIEGTFAGGSLSLERDYSISQAGQVDVTANVQGGGPNGKFTFGLENKGSIDAEMTAIRVDSTTTDARQVSNGAIFSVTDSPDPNNEGQLISSQLDIDDAPGSGNVQLTTFDNGKTVILRPSEGETTFEFDKFRNPAGTGSPNVNMVGATVTITVEFSDGSTESFELEDT